MRILSVVSVLSLEHLFLLLTLQSIYHLRLIDKRFNQQELPTTIMIFLILFNIFATVLAVPTSLLNTLAFNTTATSSIARRWNHGGCSFHVTIKEYYDWDQRPHRGGWQLFTTVHIPWIRDGKGEFMSTICNTADKFLRSKYPRLDLG
jgi:hypothetical protein